MYKAKVLFTCLILVVLGFTLLHAQDLSWKSGTIIVVHYTDDMISVAADSRQTSASNSNNNACKITRLGNHAFFAMTGVIVPGGTQLARATFDEMPNRDIREVAEQWAKSMTQSYKKIADKDPVAFAKQGAPTWRLVTGIFGTNIGNRLQAYDVAVGFCLNSNPKDEDNFIPSFSTSIWGPTPQYPYTYYGSDDTKFIKEFMERKTQRATKVMDDMMNSVIPENTSRDDLEAMVLNTAIQYALDSPKHSDEIGGDIDILELPRIGNSSWKKIKPACEDNQPTRH